MKCLRIFAVALLVAGCHWFPRSSPSTPAPLSVDDKNGPCDQDHGGHNGPADNIFVCIDWTTFDQGGVEPSPKTVKAWHNNAINFWFYNAPATAKLAITPSAGTQVKTPVCAGIHCVVVVPPWAIADHTPRKYRIDDLTSHRFKDPEILIEP